MEGRIEVKRSPGKAQKQVQGGTAVHGAARPCCSGRSHAHAMHLGTTMRRACVARLKLFCGNSWRDLFILLFFLSKEHF